MDKLVIILCIFIFLLTAIGFGYFVTNKMVFYGVSADKELYDTLTEHEYDLEVGAVTLQGWRVNGVKPSSNKVLIYFGGNAQENAGMLGILRELDVATAYTFNYRGYGLSEGRTSEKMLYSDALKIFDSIRAEHQGAEIAVLGFSLGSAVAGHVIANREVHYAMLLCPISNIGDMTKLTVGVKMPDIFLPAQLNLLEAAKQFEQPVLAVLAGGDTIIPNELSLKVCNVIGQNCKLSVVEGAGHNEIFYEAGTFSAINNFINSTNTNKSVQ